MEASEMEDGLFEPFGRVQEETHHIPWHVKVREEYGIYISLRIGPTKYNIHMGVSEANITRNNQWRKVEATGNNHAGFSMMDYYTHIK